MDKISNNDLTGSSRRLSNFINPFNNPSDVDNFNGGINSAGVQSAVNAANNSGGSSGKANAGDVVIRVLDSLDGILGHKKGQDAYVPPPPQQETGGMSTMAVVGIGAGVLVLAIIGFVVFKK